MEAGETKTEKIKISLFSKKSTISDHSLTLNDGRKTGEDRGKHPQLQVGSLDATLVIISLVTYIVDALTDIMVAVQYFLDGRYTWFGLTIAWVVCPFLIIQAFSLRWLVADGKLQGCTAWITHSLHCQPMERYITTFRTGLRAMKSTDDQLLQDYFYMQNDVCMLRLFEAFLESAPQLCLQLYIMLCTDHMHWLTGVSAVVSLIALGWAVATYTHALRRAYKQEYRVQCPALLLQTLWHISMTAARIAALVAFASVFKAWVFVAIGVHWVLMTAWVIAQRTDFCPSRVEEIFFDAVMGLIYCFSFLNLKEGPTRVRMAIYYAVILLENILLVGVWYPFRLRHVWYNQLLMSVVFVAFAFGVLCLLLYYAFFHPTGVHPIFQKEVNPMSAVTPPIRSVPLNRISRVTLMPQQTSTVFLPRRSMLKLNPDILYKEVFTPSKLSPIRTMTSGVRSPRKPIFTDCTLQLDGSSAYQHYSVDATACMGGQQESLCCTLEGSGIDLSTQRAQVRPLQLFVEEEDE